MDMRERKITFETEWKDCDRIEMIESVLLCGRYYIVNIVNRTEHWSS